MLFTEAAEVKLIAADHQSRDAAEDARHTRFEARGSFEATLREHHDLW